jgi:phosphate-selective porin OprO/OprP
MWQLGLRVDGANLNDGAIKGGQGTNLTLGVNWYWRSNAKFMLNYVAVQSSKFSASAGEDIDDNPGILEARAQFYW